METEEILSKEDMKNVINQRLVDSGIYNINCFM